jgi:N-acetylmuramoyl-L-alanine amidase
MRRIDTIVIHYAASPQGLDVDIEDVRRWHMERGWNDVGYHYFIKLDGTIQIGRDLKTIGAHVKGHNRHSIGVCYAGGTIQGESADTRTEEQEYSLGVLLTTLKRIFPFAKIVGHRDLAATGCPGFDAKYEYSLIS